MFCSILFYSVLLISFFSLGLFDWRHWREILLAWEKNQGKNLNKGKRSSIHFFSHAHWNSPIHLFSLYILRLWLLLTLVVCNKLSCVRLLFVVVGFSLFGLFIIIFFPRIAFFCVVFFLSYVIWFFHAELLHVLFRLIY